MKEISISLAGMSDLLVDMPPNSVVALEDAVIGEWQYSLNLPDLQLYCTASSCRRPMIHSCGSSLSPNQGEVYRGFLKYKCNHCRERQYVFAITTRYDKDNDVVVATKVGQVPGFGPPLSDKMLVLTGADREVFLKGRRSENQGLGIGAFAYYRRVVENQRGRILDLILSTAEKLGLDQSVLEAFEQAKQETQFTKSVELVKDVFPDSLRLTGGHNPLTLLHSALSDGLHAQSDEDCLKYASAIRVVLTALAERVDRVLSDEKEVEEALKTLLHRPAGGQGS